MEQARQKLVEATRALLARGMPVTIATACAEAGVDRTAFRAHFPTKAALMAALAASEPDPARAPEPEPAAAIPDAWLERRLRVFERALNALEAQAEARAREQAQAIAQLEEKLFALGQGGAVTVAESPAEREPPKPALLAEPQRDLEPVGKENPSAQLLAITPQPVVTVSKAEMADVLQSARDKARFVPDEEKPKIAARLRWLTIGALSLAALFLCVGLTLGDPARAARQDTDGIAYRHVSRDEGARTMALADAGNADAQAKLALAYLRGTGVTRDPSAAARWSAAAARAGQPVAQYLLGALYSQGSGVTPDPGRALSLFVRAASRGNLKAMHNLAIAYAQGSGIARDDVQAAFWFERAARRGYVDSAFDLAVLYERGLGVKQDLGQALGWYLIAARQGDEASRARAAVLRGQLSQVQLQQADDAARDFTPLAAPPAANRLPSL